MTPEQCRAARALLDWSQDELARAANVSLSMVRNFEKRRHRPTANNLASIRRALEAAGAIVLDPDQAGGPGARLAKAVAAA